MRSALLQRLAERLRRRRKLTWVNSGFRKFSQWSSKGFGSPWTFVAAALICIIWMALGPHYNYSETWHLFINDLTNVVTFLAVFLIQNTQNRDAKAIHLKLDELLRAVEGARNHMIDLEELSDEELEHLQRQFQRLRLKEERKAEQLTPDVR